MIWVCALVTSAHVLYTTSQWRQHREQQAAARRVEQPAPRTTPPVRREPAPQPPAPSTPIPVKPQPTSLKPPMVSPPLNVKLLGTMIDDDPSRSAAILEDGVEGTRRSYTAGETIQGRQLAIIARGYVILSADGKEERVNLEAGAAPSVDAKEPVEPDEPWKEAEEPLEEMANSWEPIVEQIAEPTSAMSADEANTIKAAIKPVSETERIVDRRAVWDALKDHPFEVVREAGLQPVFASGQLVGVQLASVPEDSVLRRGGFQAGDVVRAVNGQPVTNPTLVLQLPLKLQSADVIEVQVERNGQPLTLTYHLQ